MGETISFSRILRLQLIWFLRLVLIGQYCIKFPKLAEGYTGWGLLQNVSLPVITLSRRNDQFLKAACYSSTGNGVSIFSRCCKMFSDCLVTFFFFPFFSSFALVGWAPTFKLHSLSLMSPLSSSSSKSASSCP